MSVCELSFSVGGKTLDKNLLQLHFCSFFKGNAEMVQLVTHTYLKVGMNLSYSAEVRLNCTQ